jgi:deoxycytidine triphosphate deaminase
VSALSAPLQQPDGAAAIDLWGHPEEERPKPWHHWRFEFADQNERLRIVKDRFYIIRSHEKIHLPRGVAVYCRASDETIGEMRIHYAGFVHPFFGSERTDGKRGTPLIFEVRGHDIDVSLRNREKMARLEFYRMAEDAREEEGREMDPYAAQTLKLSKFFAAWPAAADCADGTVTPR